MSLYLQGRSVKGSVISAPLSIKSLSCSQASTNPVSILTPCTVQSTDFQPEQVRLSWLWGVGNIGQLVLPITLFWPFEAFEIWTFKLKDKNYKEYVRVSLFRFVGGVYETAAWNSVTSILMALYPDKVASVMSWTQMFFGFGYMIGTWNIT